MSRITSKYLRATSADDCLEALIFAEQQGWSLNVAITVQGSLLPRDLSIQTRMRRVQERFRHSLSRRGHTLAWYYVFEGEGATRHVHLHAHNPFPDLETFRVLLLDAFKADDPGPIHPNAVRIKSIGSGQPGCGGALGWWRYLFKGLPAPLADNRRIRAEFQGRIDGKRSGTSQSIGRAARKRAGFGMPKKEATR